MTTQVTWDTNGFARGFPHHDGFLEGVLVSETGQELHLALRSSDGERRVLTLRRVVALRVDDFRGGNIVHNLRLTPASSLVGDAEVHRMVVDLLELDPTRLSADTSVFRLESSIGAGVVAVCGGVEISEPGSTLSITRRLDPHQG